MNNQDTRGRLSAIVKRISPLTPAAPAAEGLMLSDEGKSDALDSVAALQLVLALEEEFGISVADEEICAENFTSLNSLCRYVEAKLSRLSA